ncbi:MAG: sigma-70 family RNA polymerase sigma factor, partial [Planctomycetia bacterium]|nr:sigma-70 family RNA polymerase sigma factor [Planctomycetia bacterium]
MPSPITLDEALAHEGFVRALARGALGRDDAVEDVVQETLLAVVRQRPAPRSVRGWLAAVVRRRAADITRARSRRARLEPRGARPEATASAADIVAREEVRRRLVAALLSLDPVHRDALLLRYDEDLPPREMAARLGVPVETARSRVKRGLHELRARLDADARGDRKAWAVALAGVAGLATPVAA